MGKGSKKKHQMRDRGINQESINRRLDALQQDDGSAGTKLPERVMGLLAKLQSVNPMHREEACLDAAAQALDPCQFETLVGTGTHRALSCLIDDSNVEVRQAAATALRNFFTRGRDDVVDEVLGFKNFAERFGKALLAQFDELLQVVQRDGTVAAVETAGGDDDEQDNDIDFAPGDNPSLRAMDELLQLATVVIEGNEAAADAFSSEPRFLQVLVNCLARQGPLQIAAAEALHVISSENEIVADFLLNGLNEEQQALLDAATSEAPVSPALLRVSVLLCGALLNCAPSIENVQRVMPVVTAATSTNPMAEVRRLLPLLSRECGMDEVVRREGVAQSFDRLRALQTGLEVLGDVINIICETNAADIDDDEAAFADNPHASLLRDSGAIDNVVNCVAAVVAPVEDVIVRGALREPCETNAEVTTMQNLYMSAEVAVLGATSSLLHLLPLATFGDVAVMWDICVAAIADRASLCGEAADGACDHLLSFQIESLAEMCWTIQRKDADGATHPQPHHLDIFTRAAWESFASTETRVFVIGAVGAVAARVGNADVTYACGKFMSGMLGIDDIDVQGEAANTLMDLYSDERFDEHSYKPLGLQKTLTDFLPHLRSAISSMPRRSPKRDHLDEIADNLREFLKYKKQNVRW